MLTLLLLLPSSEYTKDVRHACRSGAASLQHYDCPPYSYRQPIVRFMLGVSGKFAV